MFKYIWMDLLRALRYLPFGLLAGGVFAAVLWVIYGVRKRKRDMHLVALVCYLSYLAIIGCLTFWSREEGGGIMIDMELFSSWGINNRNNAYVIENVLLFIPYGITSAWTFTPLRRGIPCALVGLATSVLIECLQLVTRRGVFQIDDILTNLLGTIIGCFLFFVFRPHKKYTK